MTDSTQPMTNAGPSGQRIAGNVAWTLSARGFAIAAAVLTIPLRVNMMGLDRYAVMGLVWAVVGYLTLFDFGLERAVNQAIASRANGTPEERKEISRIFWTAMVILSTIGLLSAGVIVAASSWLASVAFNVPDWLHNETVHVLWMLAFFLPLQMISAGLFGALESVHRFDLTSIGAIIRAAIMYIAPLIVLLYTKNLVAVASSALIGQFVLCVFVAIMVYRVFPPARRVMRPSRAVTRSLMRTGAWMNLITLLGPLMNSIDRILIGALVSTSAVAYYTISYDSITRLWVLPVTFAGVLFPVFAELFLRDRDRASRLAQQGIRFSFLAILPITLLMSFLAWDVLDLWIGQDVADGSGRIFQIMALATCLGSISYVPFALLQTAGRSDIIAKVQLVELPLYVGAVVIVAQRYGIKGVSIVFLGRLAIDAFIMYQLSMRYMTQGSTTATLPGPYLVVVAAAFAASFLTFHESIWIKLPLALAALLLVVGLGWTKVLSDIDRSIVVGETRRVLSRLPVGRHEIIRQRS